MSLQSFRKRALSSFNTKKKTTSSTAKPPPPPRSLPTTFRKPRRNIGDVVLISNSSKIYLEYRDENHDYACLRREKVFSQKENDKKCDNESLYVNVLSEKVPGNVINFKNKFYIGALESQEISCFIGKN